MRKVFVLVFFFMIITGGALAQTQPPAPQGYGPPPGAGYGQGQPPAPQGYGPSQGYVQQPPPGYGPPPQQEAPPPYQFAAPPDVVPIPGTYAYFVPGNVDVLFYQGYWYRPFGGRWYRAMSYNGPWIFVPGPRVPRALVTLPPGWRRVPPGYRPIPHAELHRNWQKWERERHWEGHR